MNNSFDSYEPMQGYGELNAELLDRLVDGTLDDSLRASLFAQFETQAEGWRRCALAFLEAQAFQQALGQIAKDLKPAAIPGDQPIVSAASHRTLHRLAWAASVLLAFAGGWKLSAPSTKLPRPAAIMADRGATVDKITPATDSLVAKPIDLPIVAVKPQLEKTDLTPLSKNSQQDSGASMLLERLARQGYVVEKRTGIATLSDPRGKPMSIPVAEVKLRYVGQRIY